MKAWQIAWTVGLAANTATARVPFPCDKLTGEHRIVAAIGPALSPATRSAVKVKKKAVVANQERPLLWHWSKPEGAIGSVVPYQKPQLFFRRYLIDGNVQNCAEGRRDDVFGANDAAQQYLLRCLVDADGDGRFEAYRRHVELVRMDERTMKPGPSLGVEQSDESLVQPFRLVPATEAKAFNSAFELRIRSVIGVKEVRKDTVVLQSHSRVDTFPRDLGDRSSNPPNSPTVELPLQHGLDTLVDGTRIVIAGSSGKWTVSAPDGFGETAQLICDGRVVETSAGFAILHAGAMTILQKGGAEPVE